MPRRPRPRRGPSPDLGSRFRRLASIAEVRQARGTKPFPEGARRARLRFPHVPLYGSPPPPEPPRSRTPPEPRQRRADSLESLRLNPSDWRTLACHLYPLVRRHDPRLADLLWRRAWEVDQGLRSRLSTKTLPSRVPATRPGLNARTVRRAYDGLMYDFGWHHGQRRRTPPLTDLRFDADIVGRILDRLESVLEPADIPSWPWDPEQAPWPQLIQAVRRHTSREATLEILACVFKRSPKYLKRLIERTPRRKFGL
jgi:hypothetical protein